MFVFRISRTKYIKKINRYLYQNFCPELYLFKPITAKKNESKWKTDLIPNSIDIIWFGSRLDHFTVHTVREKQYIQPVFSVYFHSTILKPLNNNKWTTGHIRTYICNRIPFKFICCYKLKTKIYLCTQGVLRFRVDHWHRW